MHLFKKAASTRNLMITVIVALTIPLFYFFINNDIEKAIPVISAIYTPIITSFTLYFIYRQMRLTAVVRLDQEHHEERLRRLDFAKYWHAELKNNFSSEEKISCFSKKLTIFLSKNNSENAVKFQELLITDIDFILTHQLYIILLQLNQFNSKLDIQSKTQVMGMAFSVLHPRILCDFEMAFILNGAAMAMETDDCVFLSKEDFL